MATERRPGERARTALSNLDLNVGILVGVDADLVDDRPLGDERLGGGTVYVVLGTGRALDGLGASGEDSAAAASSEDLLAVGAAEREERTALSGAPGGDS